ncbi:MAG: adenylate/guanylate cyclase domain-containing protein [Alphaproteobacteria bacterium]|nr:adenylate/guanylate cyclase domain-containing protein [Alphaproteobacteria bacterium]MCB9695158.1 adenylate/guanylate cyclase domain-containing protein [Alphaproteobacteria bacterium]
MTHDAQDPSPEHEALLAELGLTELVRLRDAVSRALALRFEHDMALVFTDIVGSTDHFARHGNESGRALQQRHVDLLAQVIGERGGRIVDTAGDGAFLCFPEVTEATSAMIDLLDRVAHDNEARAPHHRLALRVAIHQGRVLTDGTIVSGDPVNTSARIAAAAEPETILISSEATEELLDADLRMRSVRPRKLTLKGLPEPVRVYQLAWRDPQRFPSVVVFADGSTQDLPDKAVIRFGRLPSLDGSPGNDVVLVAGDTDRLNRISRFHFELHRHADGYVLRSVTHAVTTVDDEPLQRGEERPVGPGSRIGVANVVTLELANPGAGSQATIFSS